MGSVDNSKLQLLESRFWEANESGGHPDEIERGWRNYNSRQDYDGGGGSRTSHPYSTRNIDRSGGHRANSTRNAPADTKAELDRLLAREVELDAELSMKLAKYEQHLHWLREMAQDDPEAAKSYLVNPIIPTKDELVEIKFISVENEIAPDLARAMIFKGL